MDHLSILLWACQYPNALHILIDWTTNHRIPSSHASFAQSFSHLLISSHLQLSTLRPSKELPRFSILCTANHSQWDSAFWLLAGFLFHRLFRRVFLLRFGCVIPYFTSLFVCRIDLPLSFSIQIRFGFDILYPAAENAVFQRILSIDYREFDLLFSAFFHSLSLKVVVWALSLLKHVHIPLEDKHFSFHSGASEDLYFTSQSSRIHQSIDSTMYQDNPFLTAAWQLLLQLSNSSLVSNLISSLGLDCLNYQWYSAFSWWNQVAP